MDCYDNPYLISALAKTNKMATTNFIYNMQSQAVAIVWNGMWEE